MELWTLENGVPSGKIGIFPTYSSLGFNRAAKAAETPGNICAVYGNNALGESTQENGCRFKEDFFFTLVTLHVQEDFRGLMKIV